MPGFRSGVASLVVVVVFALGCGEAGTNELRVCAAASLAQALPEILESAPGSVTSTFGASGALARQIRLGAPCDIFISADARWPVSLASDGLTRGSSVRLATNVLVVATPHGAPHPTTLENLREPLFARIAVAGPEAPLGEATRSALDHAHLLSSLEPRFVLSSDANTTRMWLARGEANAGFVYATDVAQDPAIERAFDVPAELYDALQITAVVLRDARPASEALLEVLASDSTASVLRAHGFRVGAAVE